MEKQIYNTEGNYVVGYFNECDTEITVIELKNIFDNVYVGSDGNIKVGSEKPFN